MARPPTVELEAVQEGCNGDVQLLGYLGYTHRLPDRKRKIQYLQHNPNQTLNYPSPFLNPAPTVRQCRLVSLQQTGHMGCRHGAYIRMLEHHRSSREPVPPPLFTAYLMPSVVATARGTKIDQCRSHWLRHHVGLVQRPHPTAPSLSTSHAPPRHWFRKTWPVPPPSLRHSPKANTQPLPAALGPRNRKGFVRNVPSRGLGLPT
ncbi:hypothetical protein PIB30_089065 [Stylosanthes scabra]|uniref:Uncharacterized protein n=1 Tax=Stylosanthes scabra TaxID=79078 RepID=A0ABU6QUC3_9FABA|nr:hypothetical protein [Stylosanthes scabra]